MACPSSRKVNNQEWWENRIKHIPQNLAFRLAGKKAMSRTDLRNLISIEPLSPCDY